VTHPTGSRSRAVSLLLGSTVAAIFLACLYTNAGASQNASLHVSLSPERLGAPTTIFIAFRISSVPVGDSMPLTNVSVSLPPEMGLAISGLGLENCLRSRLEESGPEGCPSDSRMGRGTATAEIPIGGERVVESAQIEVFSSPVQVGRLALMVYATALSPVFAQLVFPATVVPSPPPYGEAVDTDIPLVPTLPGAPDVAVTRFQMTLGTPASGPDRFVYYRSVRGRRVAYSPRGLILPPVCPPGGFPFKAHFIFQDGTAVTARVSVPCPRQTRRAQP
jgi:hypothetical protein